MGKDSVLIPVSELRSRRATMVEIEIYQAAESGAAVRQFGYLPGPADWYIAWLAQLRSDQHEPAADAIARSRDYLSRPPDDRRLTFSDALIRIFPQSRKAPLVLFRLFPLSVQVVTASAFGDPRTAESLRRTQSAILPAIDECRQCKGRVLESVEQCRTCGNPLWNYHWLTAAD
jgi:hypothetical protein